MPFVLACSAFYYISSMPKPPVPEVLLFPHSDKLLHAIAYGGLAVLASWGTVARPGSRSRRAFRRLQRRPRQRYGQGMRFAFILALGYGIFDECHQAFVPGRSASFADWLADGIGAGVALLLLHLWRTQSGGDKRLHSSTLDRVPSAE
jgi:hypothetical protein